MPIGKTHDLPCYPIKQHYALLQLSKKKLPEGMLSFGSICYVRLSNFVLHFGQVIVIVPLPFGTRRRCLQLGQL